MSTFPLRRRAIVLIVVMSLILLSYLYINVVFVKKIFGNSIGDASSSKSHDNIRNEQRCVEKSNFVFIKQMKCATSTLISTFYRFGYKRNLSFVAPIGRRIYLNWPYPMTTQDFRPSSTGYNILADHSIYTEDVMSSIMPVYLSILRHPFTHAKSVFQYFKLGKIAGIPDDSENPFVDYFSRVDKYDAVYKQSDRWEARACIPDNFSMTRNLMSHCLGMPLGFPPGTPDVSTDQARIGGYIDHIEQTFSLIMIVEYFYESLVLLRRLMCWGFNDVVFIRANVASYSFNTEAIPDLTRTRHRRWSSVDYRLFEHFNKTLWRKISQQSGDFFEEVSALKQTQGITEKYCRIVYTLGERPSGGYPHWAQRLAVGATRWSPGFEVTPEDCWMLGPDTHRLLKVVQCENDIREASLLHKRRQVRDNRIFKGLC